MPETSPPPPLPRTRIPEPASPPAPPPELPPLPEPPEPAPFPSRPERPGRASSAGPKVIGSISATAFRRAGGGRCCSASLCLVAIAMGLCAGRSAFQVPEAPSFEPRDEPVFSTPVEGLPNAPVEIQAAPSPRLPTTPGRQEIDATDYELLGRIRGEWEIDLGGRGEVRVAFTDEVASQVKEAGFLVRIYRAESRQLPDRFSVVRVPDGGGNFIAFHGDRGETRDVFENIELQGRDLFAFTEATSGRRRYARRTGSATAPPSDVAQSPAPEAGEAAPTGWQEPAPSAVPARMNTRTKATTRTADADEIDNLWKIARRQREARQYGPLQVTLDRILEINPRHPGARRWKTRSSSSCATRTSRPSLDTQELLGELADAVEDRDLDDLRRLVGRPLRQRDQPLLHPALPPLLAPQGARHPGLGDGRSQKRDRLRGHHQHRRQGKGRRTETEEATAGAAASRTAASPARSPDQPSGKAAMTESTSSMSAAVWSAEIWKRIDSSPLGTTGKLRPVASTPWLPQVAHQGGGFGRVAHHQRGYRVLAREGFPAQLDDALREAAGHRPQVLEQHPAARAVEQLERLERGRRFAGRDRIRIDVGGGAFPQIVGQQPGCRSRSRRSPRRPCPACRSERRPGRCRCAPRCRGRSAPKAPTPCESSTTTTTFSGIAVVVAAGQLEDLGERRVRAAHAENAVGHQHRALAACLPAGPARGRPGRGGGRPSSRAAAPAASR